MLNTFSLSNRTKTILFLGLAGISSLSFAQTESQEMEGFLTLIFIGWIFMIMMWLVALGLFILWIFMLIHAAKHDIHNKTTWIILMCLLGFPVSIIYFFTERKRFNTTHTVTITPITPIVIPLQPAAETAPIQPTNIV